MKKLTPLLITLGLLLTAGTPSPMSRFPVAWVDRDEPAEERDSRLDLVWKAVRHMPQPDRAAVLAVGFGESRFAEYVMRDCVDKPKDATGNCDNGKARGPWQLWPAVCPELHALPRGHVSEEAIRLGAECARRHWRFALNRCGGNVEQSFASYGGRACSSVTASTAFKLKWFRLLGGGR